MDKEPEVPRQFIHVTPSENVENILNQGLDSHAIPTPWNPREGGGSYRPSVHHFAHGIEDARKWGTQIANAYRDYSWEQSADDPELETYPMDESISMSMIELTHPELYGVQHGHQKDVNLNESFVEGNVKPEHLRHLKDEDFEA